MKPEKSIFTEKRHLNRVKENLGGEKSLDMIVQGENLEQIQQPLDREEVEILNDMRKVTAAHEIGGSTLLELDNSGQKEYIKIPVEKAEVAKELGLQANKEGEITANGQTLASLTRYLSRTKIGQFMLAALAMAATFSTMTGCDESGMEKPAESSSSNPDNLRTNKKALTSTNQLDNLDHNQVQEACWTQDGDFQPFAFEINKPGTGLVTIVAFERDVGGGFRPYYVEGSSILDALNGTTCPTPQEIQNIPSGNLHVIEYDLNSGRLIYDVSGLNFLSTAPPQYNGGLLEIDIASANSIPGNLGTNYLEVDSTTNPSRLLIDNLGDVHEVFTDGNGYSNLGFQADNCGIPTPVINNSTPNSVYTYIGTQFSSPGGLDKCELAYAPTESGVAGSVNRILSLYPKRLKGGPSVYDDGNTEVLMFHAETNQTTDDSRIHFIEIPPEAGGICGDNNVDTGETCDDGNTVTEECNYGEQSCQVCDDSCQEVTGATSYCGDNNIDSSNGETCDDGNSVTEVCVYGEISCQVCDDTCQEVPGATSYCGDNNIDSSNGESCDDGNTTPGDGCDDTCQTETADCGNNMVEFGETCDDGNSVTEVCVYGEMSCDVCNDICQEVPGETSYCGDGQFDMANEFCEGANCIGCMECAPDHNVSGGVCVDASEVCGNGQVAGGEVCDTFDDPNCVDCTSCVPNFGPENGVCVELEYCGDLEVNNGEFCDDLNCNETCTACVNGFELEGNLCLEVVETPEVTFDTSCESDLYANERINVLSLIDSENPYKITSCDGQKFTVCGQGVMEIEVHEGYTPIRFENRGEQDPNDPTIFSEEDGCFTLVKPTNEGLNPTMVEDIDNFFDAEQDPNSHLPLDQPQIELGFEYGDGTYGVLGLSGTRVEMNVKRNISMVMQEVKGEVTEDLVTSTKIDANGVVQYSIVHRAGTESALINYDENGPARPDLPGEDVDAGSDVGSDIQNPDAGEMNDVYGPDAGSDIGVPPESKNDPDDCGCSSLSGKESSPGAPAGLALVFAAAVAATLRRRKQGQGETSKK